jgi:hypothetical protein
VWTQDGYTEGHSHRPSAMVMVVSHVPVSTPVTRSHRNPHALPLYSGPYSPWHSSAVNSAGTSTASDLHGLYAGPLCAPIRQVSLKTAMFKAQHNVQEWDNFKVFLLHYLTKNETNYQKGIVELRLKSSGMCLNIICYTSTVT